MMRRRIATTALTILLLIFFSALGRGATSSLRRNAEIAFAGGQFEYAYVQWKRLLEREPRNPAAAAGLLKVEGIARDLFEEALMLLPASPDEAKENLMTVLLITDPWSEINREARNLLGDGASYMNRGAYRPLTELIQESTDILNSRKIISKLRKIAARYPDSPVPRYLIGQVLESGGDRRGAVREYRKAIKIRENCARCREALGRVLMKASASSSR